MEIPDSLEPLIPRLLELLRLEPFLSKLINCKRRPELHGLASACPQLCRIVSGNVIVPCASVARGKGVSVK
jgi:hypothetical protein